MIVVPCQIVLINKQVMVAIQFPKFTIDDIEMFVAEVCHNLIDILLFFEQLYNLQLMHATISSFICLHHQSPARQQSTEAIAQFESYLNLNSTEFTCNKSDRLSSGIVILPDQLRLTV